MHPIRVYCPNLNDRLDRRKHIEQEFRNKPEFSLTIVPAIQDRKNGAQGLYQTFIHILNLEMRDPSKNGYFIFAEDDHEFLPTYSFEYLLHSIKAVNLLKAEILVGGPTFFHIPVQCTPNLFWIKFSMGRSSLLFFIASFITIKQ